MLSFFSYEELITYLHSFYRTGRFDITPVLITRNLVNDVMEIPFNNKKNTEKVHQNQNKDISCLQSGQDLLSFPANSICPKDSMKKRVKKNEKKVI